jgi:hypothetical protein
MNWKIAEAAGAARHSLVWPRGVFPVLGHMTMVPPWLLFDLKPLHNDVFAQQYTDAQAKFVRSCRYKFLSWWQIA